MPLCKKVHPKTDLMSSRIITLLFFASMLACDSPYNNSPGQSGLESGSEAANRAREQQAFQVFLDRLSETPIISPSHDLQQLAKQYFPDSTIHRDHHLHARPIPFQETRSLIYYEYSMETPAANNTYLGVFSKEGEALDLLKIKEVSFDGSISVKLVDQKILELEYYDFFHSDQLFKDEIYTDKGTPANQLPYSLKTSYRPVPGGNEIIDYYYYENYTFNPDGSLQRLNHVDEIIIDREYPFVSLKVLSYTELANYSREELRAMINEIYAAHGFIFRNDQLIKKYQRLKWYEPRHANIDPYLSDVEKLNIKKLAEVELRTPE